LPETGFFSKRFALPKDIDPVLFGQWQEGFLKCGMTARWYGGDLSDSMNLRSRGRTFSIIDRTLPGFNRNLEDAGAERALNDFENRDWLASAIATLFKLQTPLHCDPR
jgi:hypothetical protein